MIPIGAPEEADSACRLNAAQIIIMSSVPVPYMKVPSAVYLPRTATGKKVSIMDYRRNKAKRTSRDMCVGHVHLVILHCLNAIFI